MVLGQSGRIPGCTERCQRASLERGQVSTSSGGSTAGPPWASALWHFRSILHPRTICHVHDHKMGRQHRMQENKKLERF